MSDRITMMFLAGVLFVLLGLVTGIYGVIKVAIKGVAQVEGETREHRRRQAIPVFAAQIILIAFGLGLIYPMVKEVYAAQASAGESRAAAFESHTKSDAAFVE